MIFRNLDSDNDWTFGSGRNNYVTRNTAIGLNIKTRIQSWLNDCFFAMQDGIDWYNRLGSKNQRELLELDLRTMILQSYGVTQLVEFDTILNGRSFSATYTINTIFSQAYQDSITVGV